MKTEKNQPDWNLNAQAIPFRPVASDQRKDQIHKDESGTVNMYKLAIKLTEANHGSFDECSKALQANNCDEEASIKALQRNK